MTMKGKSWKDPELMMWLLFAAVVVAVYLLALDLPLLGPDEPRYAQVGREMFERGDLVTPTLGGHNWFEKPALLYWLQYLFYSIFGVNEFAARFGSVLFGLGTIVSLFVLGRFTRVENGTISNFGVLFEKGGRREFRSRSASLANYLALISASSLGLLVFSRAASFDVMITFPVTASLVGFYVYDLSSKGPSRYISLAAFYFFIGMGLIAKGLIGAVFPVAIVTFYFLLSRRWPARDFVISLVWGGALSLFVAAFWYLPMFLQHGRAFWDEFFLQHHFQRYTSNKYRHPGPFWYFLVALPLMTIPWLPFFLGAVWKSVRRMVFQGKTRTSKTDFVDHYPSLVRFAFAWMLVPLVFFSMSGSKLPGYILPALPAALILAALFVRDFAERTRFRALLVQLTAFIMFLVVALILNFALPRFAREDSTKEAVRKADAAGYSEAQILNMHTVSHNIEFYGAGRLVREGNGKQWKFLGVPGVVNQMNKNGGGPVLVLIPRELENQLTGSDLVKTKLIDRNGELTLFAVELANPGE